MDREFLRKPKRWEIHLISRFMGYFGMLSVVFDLSLILPLVFVMKVSPELFRTAWFLESALSEIVVTFAIRTRLPFFKSTPSTWLVMASVVTGCAAVVLTYVGIGHILFGFVRMPAAVLMLVGGVLLAYFVAVEAAKRRFFATAEL